MVDLVFMVVRRLHSEQPASFEFTPDNLAWAQETIAKYPSGKQASAVIPLLWRAQEQHAGWLPEPAIRYVGDMLDMPYIRVYEIATFYTMFHQQPVGKYHVRVCTTLPCALCGAEGLSEYLQDKLKVEVGGVSDDGMWSLENVECLGACINAPMMLVNDREYYRLNRKQVDDVLAGMS